jgi:type VI protein secretion system component VasF
MDIKLQALKKTFWQMVEWALVIAGIYAVAQYVPAWIIVIAVIAGSLAAFVYFWYRINLSNLEEEQE